MKPSSLYRRILYSKAAAVIFFSLMAFTGWLAYRDIREKLASPIPGKDDLNFLVVALFVLWCFSNRPLPWWRNLFALPILVVCALCDRQALRHAWLAVNQGHGGVASALWTAAFFGAALVCIVAFPIEESLYRFDKIPRDQLKKWPIFFGLTGGALIFATALWFYFYVSTPPVQPMLEYANVGHRATIYLSLAFVALAMARVILPLVSSRPIPKTGAAAPVAGLQ